MADALHRENDAGICTILAHLPYLFAPTGTHLYGPGGCELEAQQLIVLLLNALHVLLVLNLQLIKVH
jgi:hypothetical protein